MASGLPDDGRTTLDEEFVLGFVLVGGASRRRSRSTVAAG